MQIDSNGYHYQDGPPEPVSPTDDSPAEDGQTANGMELDEDPDAPGSPAPEEAPFLQTLTTGESRGVQSDKVAELGPQTSILTVPESSHVMHTAWNPKDPTILAASGDALCRIWFISRMASSDDTSNHKAYVDLLDPSYGSLVTAMAWDPMGDVLAVATRDESSDLVGAISLWSKAGRALDELPATQDMVITLRWSPSSKQLLGITTSGPTASSLTLWNINSSQAAAPYPFPNNIIDAAWTSDYDLSVCGNGIIASSFLENQMIVGQHTRPEPDSQYDWTHIRYDPHTHTTALAAEESAVLALIDFSDTLRTITAHDAEITDLAYQPINNLSAYPPNAPRLLATSSLDGTIKVWDAKRPFTLVHTLSLGYTTPAMAMSFTPDGYLVAAANWNKVLIWNAEAGGVPKASWKGVLGKLPNGLLTNGHGAAEEEDGMGGEPNCSLSWDADGGKLALGVESQVSFDPYQVSHRAILISLR